MTIVEDIVSDAPEFRRAVQARQAYRPVYVKIKLMFGCNLKCEMCNHWRETREPPLSIDRFRSRADRTRRTGLPQDSLLRR